MVAALEPELLDVGVSGGTLRVARWAGEGPVVVAAHGITANYLSWGNVAAALAGRVTLVAPDLRGRGESGTLPPPYGMAAHADDLVAVLDRLGVERAPVVGHSMGGFAAATMARRHPERVERMVLVDGGLALTLPPEVASLDVDTVLAAVIGPAMTRLTMSFESRAAYRAFWRDHPALREDWDDVIDAYIQHDLVGDEPQLHSSCAIDAIRDDGRDTLVNAEARDAVHHVSCPAVLLWAPRGLMNETPGLYTEERIAASGLDTSRVVPHLVDDVNHYTIVVGPAGANRIAPWIAGDS